MDKENGKSNESSSGSTKASNTQDPSSLLDAASLFAYWPRGDAANAANAANLFAAAGGGFGLPPHPSLPFGMLPPSGGGGRGGSMSSLSASSSAAAAAYNNAYTNTLSVAASQAASLGIPAASAAWWSMASHLAAQDYLARLQASGMNFPSLGNPSDLQYSSLGLPSLSSHHKSSKNSKSSSLSRSQGHSKDKLASMSKVDSRIEQSLKATSVQNSKSGGSGSQKYSNSGLSIQPSMKLPSSNASGDRKQSSKNSDLSYMKHLDKPKSSSASSGVKVSSQPAPSIFTSPLTLASNSDKNSPNSNSTQNSVNSSSIASLPSSILSDPNSILGGVRLPPDTEIIKYTSSIVGPKIPGTTNRGRKKTISLDPPVDQDGLTPPSTPSGDRVEVIKLPATNGSPSSMFNSSGGSDATGGDYPLNLSLKPSTAVSTASGSSSLNSLSNMSANIGVDRISRRKPGPKPRRVVPSGSQLPPAAPSASLAQLFAQADSPRPPSRNEGSDGGSSTSSTCAGGSASTMTSMSANHKEGRPRNLGRGVSKPKKNTVASLLAQSRALGIKPGPMLDPNASMNQQMNVLKSNILAAQQYISEAGGDEKALNKFLQEKFRGTLSDSSTVDASTDSDNLTDSNHTDSEMESEVAAKKQKQYDERLLRVPLELGWKRETVIRGLTKNGGIKGDVTYVAPDSSNKFKQMSDITQYLEYQKNGELSRDNFTFSCRVILGDYLQPVPPEMATDGSEFIHLSEEDVNRRLEELKMAMRTSLPVEQRIEMARKQQAARAAARLDREQARLAKEIERTERQEAARRDREARSQQMLEGRKRLAFTLEQKMQIISEIEAGKLKSDVSRELGLASSTVATIWKNRDNILNAYSTENIELQQNGHFATSNAISIPNITMAKRKRQEELEKHRLEEQQRKQQERELKRQQAAILKEQMYIQEISKQREILYTVELERERRRQHMALVKALENRRKLEERERKKQQLLAEKQANKEKKKEQRKIELEILNEIRKPCEDLELDQKPLPEFDRIPNMKMPGKAFADILMVFEFLHNFGETLGFDMESLPTLDSLQQALLPHDNSLDAEEELFSVMTHLLVCAIEDPGIPNPARHTTILGQSLRQADITHQNLSEILRIYLYANATGEVKALTGVHFERDREKRIADHHQNDNEMQQTQVGKNSQYYELLHENPTYKMSDMLKDKPFMALSATDKAAILAFICNELLQNKAVIRQIEVSLETVVQQRKEKWLLDTKIRKLKMLHSRKVRSEAMEKAQKADGEEGVDSPSLHKDDLLDEDENDMSENESVGTQPEEEEDNKLSGEELGKKLEKFVKSSESQLHALNVATHQLRATCYGQDRYWRRYWSMPKAGGIFVEAIESADYAEFENQFKSDSDIAPVPIQSLSDVNNIVDSVEKINDTEVDQEVSNIVAANGDGLQSSDVKMTDDNENEHRKTPNRLNTLGNGELPDNGEKNLVQLQKSVDDIVQNLERNIDLEKQKESQDNNLNNHVEVKTDAMDNEPIGSKKFNLFERLGQCMERENKTEEDLKADVKAEVKEELKNEILNELKSEIKTELKTEVKQEVEEEKIDPEHKWFSIVHKDGSTCEGVQLTAGNKWENGVGACTRDNITELKIPVFPPPGSNSSATYNSCDSPAPLQMTPEESVQLELIKKHGMPASCTRMPVPKDKRYGWWRITEVDQLREVLDNLHMRGVRERELKRNFVNIMQTMYENQGRLHIEEGSKELSEFIAEQMDDVDYVEDAPRPDPPGSWNQSIAHRVDLFLLEQVEALEDKVASASMQVKGWKLPSRDLPEIAFGEVVKLVKERLSSLEQNIERRYLKPPLGVNTGDPNLAALAHEAASGSGGGSSGGGNCGSGSSLQSGSSASSSSGGGGGNAPASEDIPKGLMVWREAVNRSQTSAQLAMCLYSLEASIAWDKSIMKAVSLPNVVFNKQKARKYNSKLSNCQFCHSGDNEDKLLLCDSCDRGYHTYCFKPKMENIPDGDWYCHECMNKATGDRNCIVCGKKVSQSGTKLILCELCPRAYHTDCIQPTLNKVPRGKWYCNNCISKKPQKKTVKKNHKISRESESSEHPPSSPAPSHSSVTTNEDQSLTLNSGGAPPNDTPSASACSSNSAAACATPNVSGSPTSSTTGALQPQGASSASKKDQHRANKKLMKELAPCRAILEDLECHDDAWPFLLPVNTKQFPTYKKIIKIPMDLSTIKKRLQDMQYKSREEFCADVRQIFNNCETFNEDDSPVGKAGHCMRQFFEARWNELCINHS